MMLAVLSGILFAVLISLPAWLFFARAISKGPIPLLKAWGIGFGIKMLLGVGGIWGLARLSTIPLKPFIWAFLISYMVVLFVEIGWTVRQIHRIYPDKKNPSEDISNT